MKAADRTQNQGLCTLTSTIANGCLARRIGVKVHPRSNAAAPSQHAITSVFPRAVFRTKA